MKKVKHVLMSFSVIVVLLLPVFTYAATQYVDGGQWNYGLCISKLCGYSDYYHDTKTHSSTVTHPTAGSNKSEAGPGQWSQAKLFSTPPSGMSYYYNVW